MNVSEQPVVRKKSGGGWILLLVFGCLFVSIGFYYLTGYLLTSFVGYRYAQRDCKSVISIADTTVKVFPKSIAPFTKSAEEQLGECRSYVQADGHYAKQNWALAYQEYASYLKNYPGGIYRQEARKAAADSLGHWADDQLAAQDFQGAEANLIILRDSFADIVPTVQTDDTLADVNLAWAKSFEASKDFASAEAKYKKVILLDPNPEEADGQATQANAAMPNLHRNWGRDLLLARKYKEAVDHFLQAVKLFGSSKSAEVSDELTQAYIQWAKTLSASDDHTAALDKITLADRSASSASVKDQVKAAHDVAIVAFSNSSGSQAQTLMRAAANTVCTTKGPAAPSVPILGLDTDTKRVLPFGISFTVPNSIWAGTPATSFYAACVTAKESTVQSCPYNGGYYIHRITINWLVEVRDLLTGKVYRKTTLAGSSPETCSYIHTFQRGVYIDEHRGDPPTVSALEAWLSKFIK